MRVKKFEAKSMKEALQMVKQELGPDAVILAARDNRRNFGLGGDASVEVTAAVSEQTLQKKKFTESRLPQASREQFASAGARQQRQVIEKMVEKRERRLEDERRAAAPRKPITSVSYIDIPDDVEESPRRASALANAAGRSVDELLSDFDQDLMTPEEFAQRQLLARSQSRARENVRSAAAAARAQIAAQETSAPQSERALARIRNAAREAWTNNPFMDSNDDSRTQRTPVAGYSRATTAKAVAQTAAARGSAAPRFAIDPSSHVDVVAARAEAAAARAQASMFEGNGARPVVRAAGGLELVQDYDFDEQYQQVHLAPRATGQPAPSTSVAPASQDVAKLQGEIKRLEKMLEGFQKVPQTFTTLHPGADYGISYDFSFMFQKLSEAGVATELVVEILKQAEKEIDPAQAKKKPIVDAWVARWFLTHTKTQATQGRLHLFVGGSGSGKTTSLVKMAAQLVVKEKKKVAILSVDGSKVGAVDQMKIYCQILNVPFAVIRNKQDWEWVMSQLRHVDHVLVDFPGLQLREIDEIHHLKSLLPPEGFAPITHLCVSATSKDNDADEMARRYKVADPNDIIFTNLDQSVQHGIIYNLQRRTGLPLNSFGIGNRIPEDIEPASKERVLDLIFKLTKLRRETT